MKLYIVRATKGQWDDYFQFTVGIATSHESAQAIKEHYQKLYHEYMSRYTKRQISAFESNYSSKTKSSEEYYKWKYDSNGFYHDNNDASIQEIEADKYLL